MNCMVRFSGLDVQNVGCLISVKNVAILGSKYQLSSGAADGSTRRSLP